MNGTFLILVILSMLTSSCVELWLYSIHDERPVCTVLYKSPLLLHKSPPLNKAWQDLTKLDKTQQSLIKQIKLYKARQNISSIVMSSAKFYEIEWKHLLLSGANLKVGILSMCILIYIIEEEMNFHIMDIVNIGICRGPYINFTIYWLWKNIAMNWKLECQRNSIGISLNSYFSRKVSQWLLVHFLAPREYFLNFSSSNILKYEFQITKSSHPETIF